jgi:hypothetical protein
LICLGPLITLTEERYSIDLELEFLLEVLNSLDEGGSLVFLSFE